MHKFTHHAAAKKETRLSVEHRIRLVEKPLPACVIRDGDALEPGVRLVDGSTAVLLLHLLAVQSGPGGGRAAGAGSERARESTR